jgi:phosphopantetheine--protein transferase-like protein
VERLDLVFEGLNDPEWIDRLARSYLSTTEHRRLAELRSDKRRREWLHGHVAAKHLVRDHLRDRHGVALDLRQIEVVADSNGAPRVRVADRPELSPLLPALAITHCQGHAIAALAPAAAGVSVGVDLERIERRAPSFELNVLTDGERAMLDALDPARRAEWITLLWVLKEAVSKALGLGLALDPREMEVAGVGADGEAEVTLYGLARDRFDELGPRRIETSSRVEGDRAFAVALLELGAGGDAQPSVGAAALLARPIEPHRLADRS